MPAKGKPAKPPRILIVNDSLPLLQELVEKASKTNPPSLWGCEVLFGAWGWKEEDGVPEPIVPLYTLDDVIEHAASQGVEGVMTKLYESNEPEEGFGHENPIALEDMGEEDPLRFDDDEELYRDDDDENYDLLPASPHKQRNPIEEEGDVPYGYTLAMLLKLQGIPVAIHTNPQRGNFGLNREQEMAHDMGALGVFNKKRDAANVLVKAIEENRAAEAARIEAAKKAAKAEKAAERYRKNKEKGADGERAVG